jgi:hypothetical protein
MIRKISMLLLIFCLFAYTAWVFYVDALSYDPLSAVSENRYGSADDDAVLSSKYAPAWNEEIYKKNLFSPVRTYKKAKPVIDTGPAMPPPRRPELVLKGIVLDTFDEYVAYIEIDRAKAVAMRKGDQIKEIEIEDISARKVVVKWKAENITLSMDKIKTIKQPPKRR